MGSRAPSALFQFRGAFREPFANVLGDRVCVVGGSLGLIDDVAQRLLLLDAALEHGSGDVDRSAGDQRQGQRVAGARVDSRVVGEDRLRVERGVGQLNDAHLSELGTGGRQQRGRELIGAGAGQLDIVEDDRQGGCFGGSDPDRQASSAVVVFKEDDVAGCQWIGGCGASQLGDVHRDQLGGLVGHGEALLVVVKGNAQGTARFVKAGLDRARSRAELLGDLGVGEASQVEQDDCLTLPRRKLGDRCAHSHRQLGRLGLFGWCGRRRDRLDEPSLVEQHLQRPVLKVGDAEQRSAHVETDAGQPGTEPVGVGEAVDAKQRSHDGLLRGVASRFRSAEHPPTGAQQWRVMTLGQLGKRPLIALLGVAHERGIRTEGRHCHIFVVLARALRVTQPDAHPVASAPATLQPSRTRRLAAVCGRDPLLPGGTIALASSGVVRIVVVVPARGSVRLVDGSTREMPLAELTAAVVLSGVPWRSVRAHRGQRHLPGWYWSATTGGHVVYESRLELARLLLADFDPDVVGIAAQPFLVTDADRRHVPDFLLRRAEGSVVIVNVKPVKRMADERVADALAWAARVFCERGWEHEVWSGTDAQLLANVRYLAGYRRSWLIGSVTGAAAIWPAGTVLTIAAAEEALRETGVVAPRPVVLGLLWSGRLRADLRQPLASDSELEVLW